MAGDSDRLPIIEYGHFEGLRVPVPARTEGFDPKAVQRASGTEPRPSHRLHQADGATAVDLAVHVDPPNLGGQVEAGSLAVREHDEALAEPLLELCQECHVLARP